MLCLCFRKPMRPKCRPNETARLTAKPKLTESEEEQGHVYSALLCIRLASSSLPARPRRTLSPHQWQRDLAGESGEAYREGFSNLPPMQGAAESYGLAAMDFEYVPASPGSQWVGESAARRRQRRLSSPSLRAYLTPAFDAVAAGDGGVSGYTSSLSSGGLDLGFDASLLRYRRACFAASTDLDSRLLLYSPQSAPPQPPPQVRAAYPAADDGVWVAGGGRYSSKREAGGLISTPGFQDFISPWQTITDLPTAARGASNSIKLPADLRSQEGIILAAKAELSTPKSEATPSAQGTSAEPEPIELDDDRITEALYGHSGKRRLPIFRDICPE
ncbi:uncharacterized protein LOC133891738 [Phragmites australis]|uniref:uncharacterized protein LOC133891738 n=1 Tax=Phragmites australis TaxID=29695 RepID=UPI002D77F124|nr:uncharacterized protein LOC133891738 [Phragmites australis]XP_062188464.1 uncharacterized protein LOC133891738 [Phragmites australis]